MPSTIFELRNGAVRKWNIKYNEGQDRFKFIERNEELTESCGIFGTNPLLPDHHHIAPYQTTWITYIVWVIFTHLHTFSLKNIYISIHIYRYIYAMVNFCLNPQSLANGINCYYLHPNRCRHIHTKYVYLSLYCVHNLLHSTNNWCS